MRFFTARPRTMGSRTLAYVLALAISTATLASPAAAQEADNTSMTADTSLLSSTTSTTSTTLPATTTTTTSTSTTTTTLPATTTTTSTTTTTTVQSEPDSATLQSVDDAEVVRSVETEPTVTDAVILTPEDVATVTAVEEAGWTDASLLTDYDAGKYTGSMYWVTQEITGAAEYWSAGFTGSGVDVAIIDTGVSPVEGLDGTGRLVYGPDLSFESQHEKFAFVDASGHGTHLAGIIAGRDGDPSRLQRNDTRFMGMAPDARLVSVKVGTRDGVVDVSQVIAAIDWVVEHRTDNGLNIRVLNLAYGTDSTQHWQLDPLSYAVERAWDAGIVVVVAAGNDGSGVGLRNPATNPHVIAVGASESNMTYDASDDKVTKFSNCGSSWYRPVDVVAPGKSIVSLRAPGSAAEQGHPDAHIEDRFLLGSGTSQAAAVVSGAAALILDQRPDLTPDQVKGLLRRTAQSIPGVRYTCQGGGLIDLGAALNTPTPRTWTVLRSASGTGSLEAARGSIHIQLDGVELRGEQDVFGQPWEPWSQVRAAEADMSWQDGAWNGTRWTGDSWSGLSWSGLSWSGLSWSGLSWSGLSWSGLSWSGLSWSGLSWSGLSWSGLSWSGLSWSTNAWN